MAKTGFLQDGKGNNSSTRLNSTVILWTTLLFVGFIIGVGSIIAYKNSSVTDLVLVATSGGTTFITIAGPVMYFLFNQKKTEDNGQEQQIGSDKTTSSG